jgi:uroporphyrinogen-III synthase
MVLAMQKNKVAILSTRPVGEDLVSKAARHGIIIDEVPFIKTSEIKNAAIEQRIKDLSDKKIVAVFTSMNATEAVGKYLSSKTSWKIFCIGHTTKKIVKKIFGEENICATADSAEQLAEKINENPSVKNIVFFCGDQRRNELPGKLKNNGIAVEEVIVYKTFKTPQALTKQYDGILFFSPSAVQSFFLKNSLTGTTRVFAIGATTADTAQPFTQLPVIISDKPGAENLVNLAIEYFSKTNLLNAPIKK